MALSALIFPLSYWKSVHTIGQTYHFVDLDRGKRRNGKLIASDLQAQIDTIRTIAQQEKLRETCMAWIEKAERIGPPMQATIDFVSSYVRQRVSQLGLTQAASYTMHAHLGGSGMYCLSYGRMCPYATQPQASCWYSLGQLGRLPW